jgi:hypothetical protein
MIYIGEIQPNLVWTWFQRKPLQKALFAPPKGSPRAEWCVGAWLGPSAHNMII